MDLSLFATDKTKEVDGVWHTLGKSRYKVARYNNPAFVNRLRELMTPHQAIIQAGGKEANEITEKCLTQAMGETILVDFENAIDLGEVVDYSPENSVQLLTKYPDFRELIASLSNQAENYRLYNLGTIIKK